jgi:hypothetical protein
MSRRPDACAGIGPDAKLLQPDPQGPSGLDDVVCEATYGNRDREATTDERRRKELRNEVRTAIHPNGALLIPSFAVERAQELIADLAELMSTGELPEIPIYVDSPLAEKATPGVRPARPGAAAAATSGIGPQVRAEDRMERFQQAPDARVADAVMEHLRLAPRRDQALGAQPGEMLRQRRLAEAHGIGQRPHRHLARDRQPAEHQQPLLVRQQPQRGAHLADLSRQGIDVGLCVHCIHQLLLN